MKVNGRVTPVFIAAQEGHAEVVKVLAELGASVDTPNNYDATPVFIAVQNGHAEVVRVLAKLGASIQTPMKDGTTPVSIAAENGDTHLVRLLHELGADLATPSKVGETPVFSAASFGHVETVRVLAELGASVQTPRTQDGVTPLFIAAMEGEVEVVRLLAQLGASVKMPEGLQVTPVFVAAQNGHAEVVRVLAEFGADITTPCLLTGRTPLEISARRAHFEAAKTLLLLGAPVTAKDLKHYRNFNTNARQFRADLQAWAADALTQHRTFYGTFLVGCTAHRSTSTSTTEQTGNIIAQEQPNSPTATESNSKLPPAHPHDVRGTRLATSVATTVTPTNIETNPRTVTNPCLPTIAGEPGLLQQIAEFAGILVGKELRRTRAIGPAMAAMVVCWRLKIFSIAK